VKISFIISLLLIVSVISGCKTTSRSPRHTPSPLPAVNRTITQHDEQIAKLTFNFNQLKESNRSCVEYINKLNKQVALLNRKIKTIEQSNKKITVQLRNEQINRKNEMDRLLKEVAKETAAAVNARRRSPSPRPQLATHRNSMGPKMQGEFYEYTVEAGATLGAIARAYKVSVSAIKKANKLKSDNIRIGQKLYIPKK